MALFPGKQSKLTSHKTEYIHHFWLPLPPETLEKNGNKKARNSSNAYNFSIYNTKYIDANKSWD